jgi:hypothetical protein
LCCLFVCFCLFPFDSWKLLWSSFFWLSFYLFLKFIFQWILL